MSPHDPLARIASQRGNLIEARAAVRANEAILHREIREALAAGCRAEDVAKAAGISRARVYQIRDGRR